MSEHIKTNKVVWILLIVLGIFFMAGAIFTIVNKQSPEAENLELRETAQQSEQIEQTQAAATENLEEIFKSAKSWGPVFEPWFGKEAPDFSVTDINGQKHSLSSYLGKNVLVVFWATWCPPCRKEIPNLIELRKKISEDELAIIAISNEQPELVKNFVAEKGINYTVATVGSSVLPSPFADVSSIPTTFFIDHEGRIKLAAVGVVELNETMAILRAEQ